VKKIKFRAWNDISKEMLYHGKDIQGLIWWNEFGEIQSLAKAELMQSTGLKDKNGKEIYEGDFIKAEWGIGNADYRIVGEDGLPEFYHWFIEYCFEEDNLEVIGNKYENPELIENEE
jgi:uncharacterized phage protein (TIGR01671 family)